MNSPQCEFKKPPEQNKRETGKTETNQHVGNNIMVSGAGQRKYDEFNRREPMLIIRHPKIRKTQAPFVSVDHEWNDVPFVPEWHIHPKPEYHDKHGYRRQQNSDVEQDYEHPRAERAHDLTSPSLCSHDSSRNHGAVERLQLP